ncbi:GNAT family N-acetyltransferase [Rapidithrix thailandica]|uniref:GNAT family N-acetyltransferase n=1 Tax=Rapidithrix thailandica TaxID=413964 RepID=A0AAW9SEF5_9BACT
MQIKTIKAEETWALRKTVMWPDRDLEYVKLKEDDQGLHFGLFKDEKLTSVVSLFVKGEAAQFRKFATLVEEQGKGYGSVLLNHVIDQVQALGVKTLWCNAREDKLSFYKKFALTPTEQTFEKGGIRYRIAERTL